MATMAAVRTGLETRLKVINGLEVYKTWPAQINTPCAILKPGGVEPEQAFGDGTFARWNWEVYVFVTLSPGYEEANSQLDPYLAETTSTGSVYGAIHADRTLGGIAASTFVRGTRDDEQWDVQENISVAGAVIDLEVWA